MGSIDESYFKERNDLFRFYDTVMLVKLLYLNYVYSNAKYNGTTGDDVWNELIQKHKYNIKDKSKVISDAIKLLEIEYNIKVDDFESLSFKEMNR